MLRFCPHNFLSAITINDFPLSYIDLVICVYVT